MAREVQTAAYAMIDGDRRVSSKRPQTAGPGSPMESLSSSIVTAPHHLRVASKHKRPQTAMMRRSISPPAGRTGGSPRRSASPVGDDVDITSAMERQTHTRTTDFFLTEALSEFAFSLGLSLPSRIALR